MKAAVALTGRFAWEIVSDLSSLMLYDPLGTPVLVGLEYVMPEGTAWTFAAEEDDDFHRILGTSGILHTFIPGFRPGKSNLLCTPVLRKGVPRWFDGVDAFVVSTDSERSLSTFFYRCSEVPLRWPRPNDSTTTLPFLRSMLATLK